MSKNLLRESALLLRKEGYSLAEISEQLHISKSTASLWMRTVALEQTAKERISSKRTEARARAAQTNRRKKDERLTIVQEYAKSVLKGIDLPEDTSRLLCSLLYWCEGAKLRKSSTFSFMNSDPNLVKTFMRLMRSGFPIDERKLRLQVHLHEYHDSQKQLLFWSNLTNIPLSQCLKPYHKPHTGIRTREGYQGCASIRYLDIQLGRKIEAIGKLFIEQEGP